MSHTLIGILQLKIMNYVTAVSADRCYTACYKRWPSGQGLAGPARTGAQISRGSRACQGCSGRAQEVQLPLALPMKPCHGGVFRSPRPVNATITQPSGPETAYFLD
jgi:hypothetical protein